MALKLSPSHALNFRHVPFYQLLTIHLLKNLAASQL